MNLEYVSNLTTKLKIKPSFMYQLLYIFIVDHALAALYTSLFEIEMTPLEGITLMLENSLPSLFFSTVKFKNGLMLNFKVLKYSYDFFFVKHVLSLWFL